MKRLLIVGLGGFDLDCPETLAFEEAGAIPDCAPPPAAGGERGALYQRYPTVLEGLKP